LGGFFVVFCCFFVFCFFLSPTLNLMSPTKK
jgi:hypothetical protein